MADAEFWTDRLRQTLEKYDGDLVRSVAAQLVRPRGEWPVEELIQRCLATVSNPAVIDRRLKDLDPAGRRVLALIGHSGQPRWRMGSLLELLAALGHSEGPRPILDLFAAGLLYPDLAENAPPVRHFEMWLGQGSATAFGVFIHPLVAARAVGEDLGLPDLTVSEVEQSVQEADGLEWPLRLSVLWQQVAATPLRLTQQRDFFKRDFERLRGDPLLNGTPPDGLGELPDAGLFAVALATVSGLVRAADGELRSDALPESWSQGLPDALAEFWSSLPRLEAWDVLNGWRGPTATGNPFPAAYLLAMMLLAKLPEGHWTTPAEVGAWVLEHHPRWAEEESVRPSQLGDWAATFLLGLAFPMRWVQATRLPAHETPEWLVRLSPLGRAILGLGERPKLEPEYAQTLFVQPNLEIIAYRQGLTLPLVVRLARCAEWKGLGAACMLQLGPETVYRALESGETFESIVQTLERHSSRPTPAPVIESLRTWANKRDRITVYSAAALLEFGSPEDLNEALARGLPATRLSDRLALVPQESQIDYRHFRLTGTRDYSLPPERCVEVEADGVTLTIDAARSDLLLETELPRFAELTGKPTTNGRRQYRLTPASLLAARSQGMTAQSLDAWFVQRSGLPASAAARLLISSPASPASLRRMLVLSVGSAEVADGLMQWPATRELIAERLGPTSLAVAEEHVAALHERLLRIGITAEDEP